MFHEPHDIKLHVLRRDVRRVARSRSDGRYGIFDCADLDRRVSSRVEFGGVARHRAQLRGDHRETKIEVSNLALLDEAYGGFPT